MSNKEAKNIGEAQKKAKKIIGALPIKKRPYTTEQTSKNQRKGVS